MISRIWRFPVVLPALAFYLYLAGSASFLGQWDTYDYLKQIVTHQLSPLGFGRPVFLGYNILLWESLKRVFRLEPLDVETVAMMTTVLLGVLGCVLFQRLARCLMPETESRMAALAFAISPMYAVYSGFIMTEVPMLVALIAAALALAKPSRGRTCLLETVAGVLFGIAVGIREQAVIMGPGFLWLLCVRQVSGSRFRSILSFGFAACLTTLAPVLLFYFSDPPGFVEHTRIWLNAIPMGQIQFWKNIQASILYALAVCPASWISVAAAGAYLLFSRRQSDDIRNLVPAVRFPFRKPALGVFCFILIPVMALWRDADVQIHPRYLILILPASILLCVFLHSRWIASVRGPLVWAAVHVVIFGAALLVLTPFRQTQTEKMDFARHVKEAVPGHGLMIAGSYSPMLDYYRGIGVRPEWQILWSGWDWTREKTEARLRQSWAENTPVYLIQDPLGWRYFESEYLHFHYLLKDCRKEKVLPGFLRIYPPGD